MSQMLLIHQANVAHALVPALRADGAEGMTFNAADDAPVTTFDLDRMTGKPIAIKAADRPLGGPAGLAIRSPLCARQDRSRPSPADLVYLERIDPTPRGLSNGPPSS